MIMFVTMIYWKYHSNSRRHCAKFDAHLYLKIYCQQFKLQWHLDAKVEHLSCKHSQNTFTFTYLSFNKFFFIFMQPFPFTFEFISVYFLIFLSPTVARSAIDGGLGLSILPLAALLTGTLLTIGIAVLLIVVLAIRKRRDPVSRNICDDKDKHLGKPFHRWQCGFAFTGQFHFFCPFSCHTTNIC